jgi:adenine-specific DNA-methyltransferase
MSENPLIGITPIMNFCRSAYGKEYAPKSREGFRYQSIHQFVDVGIVINFAESRYSWFFKYLML